MRKFLNFAAYFLVLIGTILVSFGLVSWISIPSTKSLSEIFLGIIYLGVWPLMLGISLVTFGLNLLDTFTFVKTKFPPPKDDEFMCLINEGASLQDISSNRYLGLSEKEIEHRLDSLVIKDKLILDLTEEGELLYRKNKQ